MRTALWLFVAILFLLAGSPMVRAEGPAAKPAAPWWLGSKAGLSREVLTPWTPVEAAGATAKVWGRTYAFGATALPDTVVTRDTKVLAGPITLRGTVDGKELAFSGPGCRTIEARPDAARLAGTADAGNLRCEATATVEYDGMVRCDLELKPRAGQVAIQKLVLEMPIDARHAGYLHFWPGRWGSVFNSTALPKDGYRGEFRPFFWLGDERCGLAWFCESERNFFNAKGVNPIEIERRDGAVVFRVNLVTAPQTIDGPLGYTFGFQATPVRPPAPDAWDLRICHMGGYGIEDRPYGPPGGKPVTTLEHLARSGVRTICFHEQWTDIQAYPATTHAKELKKLADACRRAKVRLLLYHGYELSTLAPEWAEYSEKCLVKPRAGGYKRTYQPKPDQTAYIVCYRSPWQDFIAAHLEKLVAEYGIGGVYLDGTSEPWGCTNAAHGCGYRRPDGSIGPTYPIFDTRSMMKRIYTIVRKHDPDGQVNVHQSTCMVIPTLSFATSYWDGEQLQGLKRRAAAGEVLPLDAFRCEFMGHNWGVPAELLHYSSGPFKRSEAMALGLLHDVPTRPGSMEDLDQLARIWRAFDSLGRREAAWLPYWENGPHVRVGPARPETGHNEVKASLYNRPGKGFLAVVANTGGLPCRAEVVFELPALKQPANLAARDVLTGHELPLAEGRLAVSLEPLGFIMVRVEPR
jgi:hypothetical protein